MDRLHVLKLLKRGRRATRINRKRLFHSDKQNAAFDLHGGKICCARPQIAISFYATFIVSRRICPLAKPAHTTTTFTVDLTQFYSTSLV
jgi:hypothetical protein